jgi:hypothetical protein
MRKGNVLFLENSDLVRGQSEFSFSTIVSEQLVQDSNDHNNADNNRSNNDTLLIMMLVMSWLDAL